MVFGTWHGAPETWRDHVSFGCRVGPVAGQPGPASTLVPAGSIFPDGPLFGRKLDREAALRHPRLAEFWRVSDFLLQADPLVREHLYGR